MKILKFKLLKDFARKQLITEISQVSPKRPERAEAPSPGQRPGLLWTQTCRPVRAKAFKKQEFIRLLPLQGALLTAIIPRAMPWARSFWAFSPFLNHLRNLSQKIYNYDY